MLKWAKQAGGNLMLRHQFLYDTYVRARRGLQPWRSWSEDGSPPPQTKQLLVRHYAESWGLLVLVETGTYLGDMVAAMRDEFPRIVSIELDPLLAQRAADHFAQDEHIQIIQGDSAIRLPECLSTLKAPALFWLDAHFSGGVTARADTDTPVWAELDTILQHPVDGHVVLIDDARAFGRAPGYPTIDALKKMVLDRRPAWTLNVADDIIRIHGQRDIGKRSA
jgi:hypothetical protein